MCGGARLQVTSTAVESLRGGPGSGAVGGEERSAGRPGAAAGVAGSVRDEATCAGM